MSSNSANDNHVHEQLSPSLKRLQVSGEKHTREQHNTYSCDGVSSPQRAISRRSLNYAAPPVSTLPQLTPHTIDQLASVPNNVIFTPPYPPIVQVIHIMDSAGPHNWAVSLFYFNYSMNPHLFPHSCAKFIIY